MTVRAELSVVGYRNLGDRERVETVLVVSGEARDGNPNAAIRSAIADLLRLRPDAIACVRAACEDAALSEESNG